MLIHILFIILISWFIVWLASHVIILFFFVTLISRFIKWLNIRPVNFYTFYHTAFIASSSALPLVMFIHFLSHCFLCFTVCLAICTDTSYLFYHTAFFAVLCALPFVLILNTCSITLPSLLYCVPRHLY
jgi:hypothetical protein